MLISICIPHYNRAKYLLAVLESISAQRYRPIEVVISDDCSKDDSESLIQAYIARRGADPSLKFKYIRQPVNLGYDGNTRAALAAGNGEYLFILGNDDALSDERAIERLVQTLKELNSPAVVYTNYCSYADRNAVVRRALATANLGAGPDIAAKVFRSFGFVGGVVYKREAFHRHNTGAYDGSIYVQIYLACRIIAEGGAVAAIDDPMVAKDVVIDNQEAVNFPDLVARGNREITAHTGGLDQVARVTCEAILPFVPKRRRNHVVLDIYRQIYLYTYPYWLFRYRRDGIFRASVNLVLGCYPWRFVRVKNVSTPVYLSLLGYYLASTLVAMCTPVRILEALKARIYRLAKAV